MDNIKEKQYQAPSVEVIELEVEGMIADSAKSGLMKARGSLTNDDNSGPDTNFWSR